MPATRTKRTTIYLDPAVHRALRERAETSDRSMSDLIDEAARALLAEDEADLKALRERADEPLLDFSTFAADLRATGEI